MSSTKKSQIESDERLTSRCSKQPARIFLCVIVSLRTLWFHPFGSDPLGFDHFGSNPLVPTTTVATIYLQWRVFFTIFFSENASNCRATSLDAAARRDEAQQSVKSHLPIDLVRNLVAPQIVVSSGVNAA